MATNLEIKNALNTYFSLGEINTLCFDLGIPYEDIRREGKTNTITALIEYAGRTDRLEQVIAYINRIRPHAKLDTAVPKSSQPAAPPVTQSTPQNPPPIVVQGDYIAGDKVGKDKVSGDKTTVGDISGSNVAIGRGGTINVQPPAETGTTINIHGNVTGGVVGGGTVNAENIAGRDINIGQAPQTKQEFQEQLAQVEALLKQAIENGDIPAGDVDSVQDDVQGALTEAAKEQPSPTRLTGKLEYVQEVLNKAAGVAGAAGKVGSAVLQATPIVAGLIKAASILFG